MVNYVPRQGDIVWLDFDPQAGHEQKGRRPALVVSGDRFNDFMGSLALVCPITNTTRAVKTHIPLGEDVATMGVVMCERIKSLDMSIRRAEFIEKAPPETLKYILRVLTLFYDED
jgi:mRNA interferase MazF